MPAGTPSYGDRFLVTSPPESLNENQVRRLRVSCQHIDRMLIEIENILNESESQAAFPPYISDISPVQRKTIEDYIARTRARLIRVLEGQGIALPLPDVPVSRAVRGRLYSIDIAAEELKPKHMQGYGTVSETLATELNGIAGELQSLVVQIDRQLAGGAAQDLKKRLQDLEGAGNDLGLLSRIERVVADRGLVEFRRTMTSILDRAEDRSFEIAVFGRVSSGKSSLLNAILGTDVLPVGVTPVTAIPTQIIHGESPSMSVSFTDTPAKIVGIEQLGEFATEQENPHNAKHVTRITVTIPASRLADGVSFVDTPGLGSLATSGAAATLAYLPKCDLGVVLIDAGTTLTEGDLNTLMALQEAAIPSQFVLSKVDLLDRSDCEKIIGYVKQHIVKETGLDLPVHPVSVRPSHRALLDRWFEEEILPLYSRSQELRAASLQRKIGLLRESVVFVLQSRLHRTRTRVPCAQDGGDAVEARLRRATGLIQVARPACERKADAIGKNTAALYAAAAASVEPTKSPPSRDAPGAGDRIRAAIQSVIVTQASEVQNEIEILAVRLQDDLVKCAGDLGIADVPGNGEFTAYIREMPVFEAGPLPVMEPRPTYAGLFGKRYDAKQCARQIRQQLEPSLEPALDRYIRVLKAWSRQVISRIGWQFETYAEQYRAQAEQLQQADEQTPEERRALEVDLRALESPVTNGDC